MGTSILKNRIRCIGLFLGVAFLATGTVKAQDKKPVPAAAGNAGAAALVFEQMAKDFLHELITISKLAKDNKGPRSNETEVLMKKASARVDFVALSKKALGGHWAKLPAAQRQDFTVTLQKLLEEVAYPKAQKLAVSEDAFKFDYIEESVEPRVKVLGEMEREKRGEMVLEKVEIALIFDKKSKKIVDAVLEGENVSQNLKRQLDESFKKKSFPQILTQMRKRIAKAQGKPDEPEKPAAASSPAKTVK